MFILKFNLGVWEIMLFQIFSVSQYIYENAFLILSEGEKHYKQ